MQRVERLRRRDGCSEERVVGRQVLAVGVDPVGEECELGLLLRVRAGCLQRTRGAATAPGERIR